MVCLKDREEMYQKKICLRDIMAGGMLLGQGRDVSGTNKCMQACGTEKRWMDRQTEGK